LIESTLITQRRSVIMSGMTLYVGSREAAHRLGVSRSTLYAYVSRGLIERRTAIDGRTSMYAVDDLDRLRSRSRRRDSQERPSIDVQISSAVTRLDDEGLWYRDRSAMELARTASFEQVAELLWTGVLPDRPPVWPTASAGDLAAGRRAVDALGPSATALHRLLASGLALGVRHPDDDPPSAARRLLAVVAAADGRRRRGALAERLARRWRSRPPPALAAAIDRALVLLADHELATSTLAARVAISVRADPYTAFTAALATVSGPLHGSAPIGAHRLLVDARTHGAREAVARRLDRGERLPGFGHTVYRNGDPRLAPLLEAVWRLPNADQGRPVVDEVLREANIRLAKQPNVDFGVAVLCYLGGLDPEVPIFAIARLAGWAAHCLEELDERPVRYRGLARPRM
jgi:citrate synthase